MVEKTQKENKNIPNKSFVEQFYYGPHLLKVFVDFQGAAGIELDGLYFRAPIGFEEHTYMHYFEISNKKIMKKLSPGTKQDVLKIYTIVTQMAINESYLFPIEYYSHKYDLLNDDKHIAFTYYGNRLDCEYKQAEQVSEVYNYALKHPISFRKLIKELGKEKYVENHLNLLISKEKMPLLLEELIKVEQNSSSIYN